MSDTIESTLFVNINLVNHHNNYSVGTIIPIMEVSDDKQKAQRNKKILAGPRQSWNLNPEPVFFSSIFYHTVNGEGRFSLLMFQMGPLWFSEPKS